MRFQVFVSILLVSASCVAGTTNILRLDGLSSKARPANDSTSTIVLTKPLHDVIWTAGTKVSIKFQSEDTVTNQNSVEIKLVKSLGNGAVDMSVQYPTGNATAKDFGPNRATILIDPTIPPGDYGVFLFATNAMTGDAINSVSSPTIHLRSSIFHPAQGAVVRKGKSYRIRWKGPAPEGVDSYEIYFQGNETADPFDLGSAPAGSGSARVTVPEGPDTGGYFYLVGNGVQIIGNECHLK